MPKKTNPKTTQLCEKEITQQLFFPLPQKLSFILDNK